jgi:Flp pilus assembly protein TadG
MEVHTTVTPNRRERGNTILEMALVFVPLCALIFFTIDVTVVIFLKAVFQNATREGVRWAITYNTSYGGSPCPTQEECIKRVVQDNSVGFLAGAVNAGRINVRYYSSITPHDLATPLAGPDPAAGINFINQTGNVVEVTVDNFPWNWMVPLPGFVPSTGLNLSASSSDVLQGYPSGTFGPPTP